MKDLPNTSTKPVGNNPRTFAELASVRRPSEFEEASARRPLVQAVGRLNSASTTATALPPQKPQKLIQDPCGLFSNPHTIDWTTSPITAMKLTMDYMGETLRFVPSVAGDVMNAALSVATKSNEVTIRKLEITSDKIIRHLQTTFYSVQPLENGARGILVELDGKVAAMGGRVTSFGRILAVQKSENDRLAKLVGTIVERADAIEKLIGEREAKVSSREGAINQRANALNVRIAEFNARCFWSHLIAGLKSMR
jgi:hypothetical protein